MKIFSKAEVARLSFTSRREFTALLTSAAVHAMGPASIIGQRRDSASHHQTSFAHPGMLHSAEDLRRMREAIHSGKQPLLDGFEKLRADPHSQLTYPPQGASAEIGRNPNVRFAAFDSDSNAAYQCALMGCITGDEAYFLLCRRILDDWVATLKHVTGADAILCAALGGFKMANAAELLRYSSGLWPQQNAAQFGRMLREVLLPVIAGFAPFANGNWDTAALKTTMAIAIYTDDRALFERAIVYYLHGCGNGSVGHYVYANGQCQESGRDQQHTQLGLGHMGDCCEMAWHQGLDLYSALENRLLLGFEYTARYILGEDVPFQPDQDRTGKYRHSVIAPRSALRPIYEQIYNHYVKRRGLEAPWTQRAAESVRPEGAGFQADTTGFGTLLYTRDAGTVWANAAEAHEVSGLYAAPEGDTVKVSWVPLARNPPYSVVRLSSAGRRSFISRQSWFRDANLVQGRRYTYRVSETQHDTSSSIQVVAGLPPGWHCSAIGAQSEGIAWFDGSTWRLKAAGSPAPNSALGGGFFVHTCLSANGSVAAYLSPEFASQALHVGVALLDDSAQGVLLLLEPAEAAIAEHISWMVRLYARIGTKDAVLAAEQPLHQTAIQYGRLHVPLGFRAERSGDQLQAAFRTSGQTWQSLPKTKVGSITMRGGMFLNSGLPDVKTEVVFREVKVK